MLIMTRFGMFSTRLSWNVQEYKSKVLPPISVFLVLTIFSTNSVSSIMHDERLPTIWISGVTTSFALPLWHIHPITCLELWLLHPQLPTKFVNTHLVVGENDVISSKKHPVQLNMVHSSSTSNKVSALKPFFPDIGTELVVDGDVNDWFSVIAQRQDSEESPEPYCSTRCNNLGKKLFMSNVKVEMNRFSKQYERNCLEITSDLMTIFEAKANDEDGVDTIDWSNCEKHIGALLLRGNRCVLVRSVSGEWEGMRIPNGRPIMVELYPLYAASAPPSYGEGYEYDESADMEDEDDPYDWYSFQKAITRLDKVSGMAIRSMTLALMQASSVGLVPSKWGGVFGQEWQLQDALNGISAIA